MSSCAKPVRVNPPPPLNTESPKPPGEGEEKEIIRRACGCLRTSDKLKNILKMFPQAPPPSPNKELVINYAQSGQFNMKPIMSQMQGRTCGHSAFPTHMPTVFIHDLAELQDPRYKMQEKFGNVDDEKEKQKKISKCWTLMTELVTLLQLTVTATALIIYYIIFCYMQLIYYMLRSVVYFHHADVPMKITISIVTVTGVFIGLNMITRMENLVGIHFHQT